ncbi:MAG: hypothetical protein WBA13_17420 [Microcoleaceae cyanobacterium]
MTKTTVLEMSPYAKPLSKPTATQRSIPFGDDIIENFEQGVNQLLININGIDSFDDLDITASGSNTIVSFAGTGYYQSRMN